MGEKVQVNEVTEAIEKVADECYEKIKKESSNYLEIKEKCEKMAREIGYRNSRVAHWLRERWAENLDEDLAKIKTS